MQEKEQIITDQEINSADTDVNLSENPVADSQNDGTTAPDALDPLRRDLEEAKAKYLYLAADFENFKRHAARERVEMIQSAGRDIMQALLPVIDDFDRAQKNGGLTDGMVLIQQKLLNTLKARGLTLIDLKIGDAFNPDQQEAVTEIPAPTEELKGKIVDILEPGYQLGDRIIRFAKVVVGK